MSTIIVGDVGEGSKWWSQAAQYKARLQAKFRLNNKFMQEWHFPSGDVKIFVRMVSGSPKAWIYTDSGYEFAVAVGELIDFDTYEIASLPFYLDAPLAQTDFKIMLPNFRSHPMNVWYSQHDFVCNTGLARYRNTSNTISGATTVYANLSNPVERMSGASPASVGGMFVGGSAAFRNYIYGVQAGDLDKPTVALVQNKGADGVSATPIEGPWTEDHFNHNRYAHGYWSFSRDGLRACTVVWVNDPDQFAKNDGLVNYTPHLGFVSSWVLEIAFIFSESTDPITGEAVTTFEHIQETGYWATDDFCIAADYDWTTEGNELVTVQLAGYDYRVAKAYPWEPNMMFQTGTTTPLAVGDHFKTTYTDALGRTRPRDIFEITAIDAAGIPPRPEPNFPDVPYPYMNSGTPSKDTTTSRDFEFKRVTEDDSAMDVWMHLVLGNGTKIGSLELAHNHDWKKDVSSDGTWFAASGGASFNTNITGMDLRVRGVTAYSPKNGSTWASAYDYEWTNGVTLPSSGNMPKPSNFYHPDKLYARIKIPSIPQTIAAIPYLKSALIRTDERGDTYNIVKDLCIYAPHITSIGDPEESNNPEASIDFKIDTINVIDMPVEASTTPEKRGMQLDYHQKIFKKYYPGTTPYQNRYFLTGVWGKKKDRP